MIAIIADDKTITIGRKIEERLKKQGADVIYISVSDLDVKPCYSCGYCTTKEYGKCVIQDDMDPIFRQLIHAEKMIIVTPVIFGSYSFQLKAVLDRTCILGDLHYFYSKGELVKGMKAGAEVSYEAKLYAAIGVKENCDEEERRAFETLVNENSRIMNAPGAAFVVKDEESEERIDEIVEAIGR